MYARLSGPATSSHWWRPRQAQARASAGGGVVNTGRMRLRSQPGGAAVRGQGFSRRAIKVRPSGILFSLGSESASRVRLVPWRPLSEFFAPAVPRGLEGLSDDDRAKEGAVAAPERFLENGGNWALGGECGETRMALLASDPPTLA